VASGAGVVALAAVRTRLGQGKNPPAAPMRTVGGQTWRWWRGGPWQRLGGRTGGARDGGGRGGARSRPRRGRWLAAEA
jgi:hypothetical protein